MTTFTLTLLDVRHVQSYLFNANELKQNLGASALVEQATHDWVFEFLPHNTNAKWDLQNYKVSFDGRTMEGDPLDAEVIFMGGGNAAILFPSLEKGREFAMSYTDCLLERAPGLEASVAHVEGIDLAQPGSFRAAWQKMQQVEMPRQKEARMVAQPILGLAVTAECAYTGLPAVAEDQDGILLSAQAFAKQDNATVMAAKARLEKLLPIQGFEYPADFEDLGGERGHARFIAVVHADGNGMGKRIQKYAEDDNNREMIRRMNAFSDAINRVGLEAMQSLRDYLAITIEVARDKKRSYVLLDRFDDKMFIRLDDHSLPIRPLVFGGDDITFVCDGRLGLTLATRLLARLAKAKLLDDEPVYACAGVAIVHTHYPFARAYSLAEELCLSAKQQARQWDEHSRVALLNWHITTSGLTLDWDDIKRSEYREGKLHLRPLVVAKAETVTTPAWQTWQTFTEQISGWRSEPWSTQRNKQKDLQTVLRKDAEATRRFTSLHGKLPSLSAAVPEADIQRTGWLKEQCLYFDALEANDLFIYPKEDPHD